MLLECEEVQITYADTTEIVLSCDILKQIITGTGHRSPQLIQDLVNKNTSSDGIYPLVVSVATPQPLRVSHASTKLFDLNYSIRETNLDIPEWGLISYIRYNRKQISSLNFTLLNLLLQIVFSSTT